MTTDTFNTIYLWMKMTHRILNHINRLMTAGIITGRATCTPRNPVTPKEEPLK